MKCGNFSLGQSENPHANITFSCSPLDYMENEQNQEGFKGVAWGFSLMIEKTIMMMRMKPKQNSVQVDHETEKVQVLIGWSA